MSNKPNEQKNPNENCLSGMKCPGCGSFGPFRIMVSRSGMTMVYDDGTDDIEGDTEWGDGSYCECPECKHSTNVGDFKGNGAENAANAANKHDSLQPVQVSLDGGKTWVNVDNDVRISFRDANEDDDTMQDLLVVVTHEGMILDVVNQDDGQVSKTTSIMIEDLVGMTQ